ncbi:MAG: ATP synthase F1 subunit gamma [Flavobacteriales bacterium]|nr:ATP synthase F1 subunit gamma [Flavobacteriales bacterium]
MANLKEIRTRIASVGANMKITQAMKMVSASKFKKASDAITHMRPYSDGLSQILAQVSATMSSDESIESPYTVVRDVKRVLVVVVTSNKGLCGAFNSNVVKNVKEMLANALADCEVDIITVGNKGRDLLSKVHAIEADYSYLYDDMTFAAVSEMTTRVMDDYASEKYDSVWVVYNRFKNAATQIVTCEQFLPLEIKASSSSAAATGDFILEPDSKAIVEGLLPQSLRLQMFRVMRDSVASEHGARMTAMHKASDNAKELKDRLTLEYNNARQAAITNQIIEIVSGAEALG